MASRKGLEPSSSDLRNRDPIPVRRPRLMVVMLSSTSMMRSDRPLSIGMEVTVRSVLVEGFTFILPNGSRNDELT